MSKHIAQSYLNIGHSFMSAMEDYQTKCLHSAGHDWKIIEAMGDLVEELEQLFKDAKNHIDHE